MLAYVSAILGGYAVLVYHFRSCDILSALARVLVGIPLRYSLLDICNLRSLEESAVFLLSPLGSYAIEQERVLCMEGNPGKRLATLGNICTAGDSDVRLVHSRLRLPKPSRDVQCKLALDLLVFWRFVYYDFKFCSMFSTFRDIFLRALPTPWPHFSAAH